MEWNENYIFYDTIILNAIKKTHFVHQRNNIFSPSWPWVGHTWSTIFKWQIES